MVKSFQLKCHRLAEENVAQQNVKMKDINKYIMGDNNPNSIAMRLKNGLITTKDFDYKKWIHQNIVCKYLGIKKIPKGYHIHHKDCNHSNNEIKNLVVLPSSTHMLIHRIFGNILLNALHTGRISRKEFFNICNTSECEFYKEIIDLSIIEQAVVKQGELLENHEDDNQQPSVFRNIYEGSTTNSRVLPFKDEDSNADKSALPL